MVYSFLAFFSSLHLLISVVSAGKDGNNNDVIVDIEHPSNSNLRGGTGGLLQRRTNDLTSTVHCHLLRVDVEEEEELVLPESLVAAETLDVDLPGNTDRPYYPSSFVCWTDDDLVADIHVAAPQQLEQLLEFERRRVAITQATTLEEDGTWLLLSPESEIIPVPEETEAGHHQRKLAQKQGTSNVIVLRVTYLGVSPTVTSSQLAGRIFGLGSAAQSVNLVSQMGACSFGKLTLVPASAADNDSIKDGVVEIEVTTQVTGSNSCRSLENEVMTKAKNLVSNMSLYHHVILVFPDHPDLKSSGSAFLAYGYFGGIRTVFKDVWAGRLSALAHEIGHNFGLSHSGKGTNRYGDLSGFMGYGATSIGGPLSCYNAQKHWDLGWMSSRAKSLSASSDLPWNGNLATFVDFESTNSDQCVLLMIIGSSQRLFLQYNRKKGMNAGTRQLGNHVAIIQDDGTSNQSGLGKQSWQLGSATKDQSYRQRNFTGGNALVIEVCQNVTTSPEYVTLSIYLDDGNQKSSCN